LKDQNLNLFLIHNEGTFAKLTKQRLQDFFCIKTFTIKRNYSFKVLKNEIYNQIKKYKLNLILYISGETRDDNFMKKLNFDLPYFIANICDKQNIPLVYLSSLSVYGIPRRKSVDVLTEKVPFTNYGKTKSAFDQVLKKNLNRLRFCSIAPGTIINPYSKKDNLLKNSLRKLSSRPLIWLLKIFSPSGNYACVHIDDLISALVQECINITSEDNMQVYKVFKNYSKKISIYNLVAYISGSKPILKINFVPIQLFNIMNVFLPKKFIMKLIVYLVDIDYISEYSSIKERDISEYFTPKEKFD
tara:strand:- start:638 stop:1540 length:903 start_codon:yes stop_codon:yes gene_type:complete